MKLSKKFKAVASIALAAALVVPAVYVQSDADAAKKMAFTKKSISLESGSSSTVKVKNCKKNAKSKWSSSNKKVATVTKNKSKANVATVKGVGAGKATITCKVKKKSAKLTVKVRNKVNTLAISGANSVKPGGTITITASINNNTTAAYAANQTIKWSSDNAAVAKVAKKTTNTAKVTGVKAGTATIKCTIGTKSATLKVTVSGNATNNNNKGNDKNEEAPARTYPPGYVYKQLSKEVRRWYDSGSVNGHPHDGYKLNNFAVWMIGFYDNEYDSTNDSVLNKGVYGPALDKYKGQALNVSGEFMYEGTSDQKTILLQLNYTKPSDYPIVWKWEKGASARANEYASELKMKGVNGSEAAPHDTWTKVDATFTIPTTAVNGDKDEETGENFGIYLYFPNKPGGALIYVSKNTFHFRNFAIKEAK